MRRDERSRPERRPQGAGSPPAVRSLALAWALTLALGAGTARAQAPADTVSLMWTAPGDDGNIGTAQGYEMRMSLAPIDESNWSGATLVAGAPPPLPAGTTQLMVARGLSYGTTYYFAIKTVDDAGNWSPISNLVRWDWVFDTAPPAAPSGLAAALAADGVRVTWTPNSEADLAGYSVYRALAASGPFTDVSGSLLASPTFLDATVPPGTAVVWYQVTARDNSGNESARSSIASLTLVATATGTWSLDPGYPNPSPAGATVHIPLTVPAGAGEARIEIVNNIGQRVRRIDLGVLASGSSSISWDGRNDAGREVAPGAYTAWLIAGSTRTSVRLVRVP
jgi:hypothetical protein